MQTVTLSYETLDGTPVEVRASGTFYPGAPACADCPEDPPTFEVESIVFAVWEHGSMFLVREESMPLGSICDDFAIKVARDALASITGGKA